MLVVKNKDLLEVGIYTETHAYISGFRKILRSENIIGIILKNTLPKCIFLKFTSPKFIYSFNEPKRILLNVDFVERDPRSN